MGRPKPQISPNCTVFYRNPQALQRQPSVPGQKNYLTDTIIYGDDDALPLRIAKLVSESPAASACINTFGKYIKGAKFSSEALMSLKIDKKGTTLWELHCQLSDIIALYRGFAVNFKYDGNGKITNTYALSFENCRLSKPDDKGYISKILYNPYFGTDQFKKEFTKEYPVFDPQQALNQIQQGTKYNGQVYYFGKTSPLARFYPVPEYWSAKKWIEVDARIQDFHANNLENGFFQSVLMNVIGDPSKDSSNPKYQEEYIENGVRKTRSTKTIGEEFNEMMSEAFSGSDKAGTALALWSENSDTAVKIQPFQNNSNADLFNALQDLCTKNITIATQVPGILANISEGVNLGSGGSEIQKAVELMQSRVSEEQRILEDFYNNKLLPNLAIPTTEKVEIVNFNPVTVAVDIDDKFWNELSKKEKIEYIKNNVPGVTISETTDAETVPGKTLIEIIGVGGTQAMLSILDLYAQNSLTQSQASNMLQILFGVSESDAMRMLLKDQVNTSGTIPQTQVDVPAQTNDALKNMTGRQLEGIQRIIRKFNKDQLTYDQAKLMLKEGFGFTDEQIDVWLVTSDEE